MEMLKNFLSGLENPKHPLLSPTLWGLQKWGMWQTKGLHTFYNLIHTAAILFVITQWIEFWLLIDDLEKAMRNLSITMLSSICVAKAATFVFWQKNWRAVIEYVSDLEQRQLSQKDAVTEFIIKQYTDYSRKVTFFYSSLVTVTVFTVVLTPLISYWSSAETRYLIQNGTLPYPEIMSSWMPFDKNRGYGYCIYVLEHVLISVYGGGIVANFDSNAVVLMSFFAGQMKLLTINCSRLFDESNGSICLNNIRSGIKACHCHHLFLVKYAKILNSLLSPVMFLYVIICSLMICASAIQLTSDNTTTMQRIWIAEYLLALIAQLFLYCWHSNEVMLMSEQVEGGVYASSWWSQDVRTRRDVILLGGQLRKVIFFTAGPFTKLNISTFVSILKGSYSYYTLLCKK